MKHVLFVGSFAALPLLGFGAAFQPSIRALSLTSRIVAALAMGSVLLTVVAVFLSTVQIPWNILTLSVPCLAVSVGLWRFWNARPKIQRKPLNASTVVAAFAISAAGLAVGHLTWSLVTAGATSMDFLLFWGVKAARFAEARAIDGALLRWPFFSHAVPDYPPAVPVVQAWSALWAGELSWRTVPITASLWATCATALLLDLLRKACSDNLAVAVAGFWLTSLAVSLAHSYSGGNAEAPLLFFETLAVAALLVEPAEGRPDRFLAGLMLVGAVLTKVEGSVAALLIAAGVLVRDLADPRRRRPDGTLSQFKRTGRLLLGATAGLSGWFLFQAVYGLEVGFRPHGKLLSLQIGFIPEIIPGMVRNLDAGTRGLSWLIPALLLVAVRPRIRELLPALTLTGGLLAFLVFDYMHDRTSPAERIRWTTPRVTQSALSALILAAGYATGRRSLDRLE